MVQRYMNLKDRVCGKYSIPLESNQGFRIMFMSIFTFFFKHILFLNKGTKLNIPNRQSQNDNSLF